MNHNQNSHEQGRIRLRDFLCGCHLKRSRHDVYNILKNNGIIEDYIIPGYDVLHTFSRSYIVDDIINFMRKKGALAS